MSESRSGAVSFLSHVFKDKEFEIIPLAGDASTRRYFRIVVDDQSYVLMSWDPFQDTENYPFLNVLAHFKKHDVKVPEVIAMSPPGGFVLLEDLGDLTLERKFWEASNPDVVMPYYEKAIDELIKIHFTATKDKTNCVAFGIQFDTEKLLWEMNYGRKHLIEEMTKTNLTAAEDKALTEIFTKICTKLDREPKRIAHRDYHSRNVMIKLNQVRVIDFQDARMGAVQYDLVSLVHDSYVDLKEDTIQRILTDYRTKAKEHGYKVSNDQFDDIFYTQMIQRCFKACGSFSSFWNTRQDTRYLKYLQPTIRKVAQTLERFPEYKPFYALLNDRGLLTRSYSNP